MTELFCETCGVILAATTLGEFCDDCQQLFCQPHLKAIRAEWVCVHCQLYRLAKPIGGDNGESDGKA